MTAVIEYLAERRTTTSIKITPASSPTGRRSASPASVSPAHGHTQHKSRLSRQVHPPADEDEDDDMDGEGEDDDGEVEDDNDETLYCFCQKQSYGDVRFISSFRSFVCLTPF